MDFDKLITLRQSCRSYDKSKLVEKEKLDNIIKQAILAPSACNSQPYSFITVNGKASENVATCCQKYGSNKFTSDCNAFIVIVEEKANLPERVGSIVLDNHFTEIDIGIVASYITLSATEQGLGCCILGLFDESQLKKLFNIDKNKRVRLVVAVGYAKDDVIRQKKRKEISKIHTYIGD